MSTRWYALKKGAQYRAAILNIDEILYLKEKERHTSCWKQTPLSYRSSTFSQTAGFNAGS